MLGSICETFTDWEARGNVRDREVVEDNRLWTQKEWVLETGVEYVCVCVLLCALVLKSGLGFTFRSPCESTEPSSEVNFFCWKMFFRASDEGDHVPRLFDRHRSLSDARIETTTLRLSGLSGDATQYELPSPSVASVAAASVRTLAGSETSVFGFSERIDMTSCLSAASV